MNQFLRKSAAIISSLSFCVNAAVVDTAAFYDRINDGNNEVVACSGVSDNKFYTVSLFAKSHTTVFEVMENFNKKVLFQFSERSEHERFINLATRSRSVINDSMFKKDQIQVGRMKIRDANMNVSTSSGSIVFDMNSGLDFTKLVIKKENMDDFIKCINSIDFARKTLDVSY